MEISWKPFLFFYLLPNHSQERYSAMIKKEKNRPQRNGSSEQFTWWRAVWFTAHSWWSYWNTNKKKKAVEPPFFSSPYLLHILYSERMQPHDLPVWYSSQKGYGPLKVEKRSPALHKGMRGKGQRTIKIKDPQEGNLIQRNKKEKERKKRERSLCWIFVTAGWLEKGTISFMTHLMNVWEPLLLIIDLFDCGWIAPFFIIQ